MNTNYSHPRLWAEKSLYVLAVFALMAAVWAYATRLEVSIRARGIVRAQGEAVKIVSEVGGKITRVYVAEGSEIRRGDPLIQLDAGRLALKQRMLESRIHFTELRLSSLQNRLENTTQLEEQSGMAQTLEQQAALRSAGAAVEQAEQRFVRTGQLLKEGLVSRQSYDDIRASLALARAEEARLTSHPVELKKAQSQARLRDLALELTPVRAELTGLYEQLEQLRQEIAELTFTSPADGQITTLAPLHAGEVISPGAAIGALVPRSHTLVIESWLPSSDRTFVSPGQRVRLQSEAFSPGEYNSFDGIVLSISPDARFTESLAGAYRVLVTPAPYSSPLHLGMTFQVHFIEREERLLWILFERVRKFVTV
jgi:multidrug resistance efflux pump